MEWTIIDQNPENPLVCGKCGQTAQEMWSIIPNNDPEHEWLLKLIGHEDNWILCDNCLKKHVKTPMIKKELDAKYNIHT